MLTLAVGLALQAGVCASLSTGAAAIAVRVFRRGLTEQLIAYGWFWIFNAILWGFYAMRYLLAGLGAHDSLTFSLFLFSQTVIFFTGPVLYYYLGLRVAVNHWLARWLAFQCLAAAVVATLFIYLRHGAEALPVTYFSAELSINRVSLGLFILEVAGILTLALKDLIRRWPHRTASAVMSYELLYSLSLGAYVALAALDEASLVSGPTLIFWRLLYLVPFVLAFAAALEQHSFFQTTGIGGQTVASG